MKIGVFRHDREAVLEGILSDLSIGGIFQADIPHVE
jgi:hypothetical protein